MNPTILIIDDDIHVVKQLMWAFHDQFNVVHAISEEEIDDCVSDQHPIAALIDMHLQPTLQSAATGLNHVRHLHSQHPDLPIIAISVSQNPELPFAALEAGAAAFLQKPFSGDQLRDALSRYA
jgi:DNA-binding NtrC family response regulator